MARPKVETGESFCKISSQKELMPIEQLEYKVALLDRELLKKEGIVC